MPNSGINLWKLNLWPLKVKPPTISHPTFHSNIAPTRKRRCKFHEKLAMPGKIILQEKKKIHWPNAALGFKDEWNSPDAQSEWHQLIALPPIGSYIGNVPPNSKLKFFITEILFIYCFFKLNTRLKNVYCIFIEIVSLLLKLYITLFPNSFV